MSRIYLRSFSSTANIKFRNLRYYGAKIFRQNIPPKFAAITLVSTQTANIDNDQVTRI